MNPKNNDCNFLSRIRILLGNRDEYPFGRTLGLGHSQIDALFNKGIIPKGLTLLALQRRENANISWLLEGRGAPYLVEHCRDDEDCRAQVRLLLEESGWTVTLAGDGARQALILTLPCLYIHATNKRPIEYTDLHILTNAGPKAVDDAAAIAAKLRTLYLPRDVFDDLISGRIGTYRLLGDERTPGLMAQATSMDDMLELIEKIDARYAARADGEPLAPDECALLEHYRRLPVSDRSRLQTIVDALAADIKKAQTQT